MTTPNRTDTDPHAVPSGDPEYDAVIAKARLALDDSGGLHPSAWARIRAGVDDAAAEEASGGFWAAWRPLIIVGSVVAAAVALTLAWPGDSPLTPSPQAPSVADGAGAVTEQAPAPTRPAPAVAHVAEKPATPPQPALRAGQVVATSDTDLEIDGFGRHAITIAAASEVRVVRFEEGGVVLELLKGSVRSDVQRRSADEVYEVRAGDVTARVVGTVFTVTRGADKTAVSVEHGVVAAKGEDGVEQRLTAGQSADFGPRVEPATRPAAKAVRKSGVARRRPARTADEAPSAARPAAEDGGLKIIEIDVPDQTAPPTD